MNRKTNRDAVLKAKAATKRNKFDGWSKDELIESTMKFIKFDPEEARRRIATDAVNAELREGSTPIEGQMCFPGWEPYLYEPQQLLQDGEKNVYEWDDSLPFVVNAEATRSRNHTQDMVRASKRKSDWAALHSEWALKEVSAGRDPRSVTWGKFIRETGIWRPIDTEGAKAAD